MAETLHSAEKPPVSPGADHRAAPRLRALRSGRLMWQNRSCSMDCVIRDQSEGGVRIRVAAIAQLPKQLELHLVNDRKFIPCEVRWQRGQEFGLQFLGPARAIES